MLASPAFIKLSFSEKGKKIWKISHLFWRDWVKTAVLSKQVATLWPSENIWTLYFRSTNFTWNKPIPPTETTGEEDEEVDDSELNLDKVEEEMAADYSDEEEEEILHIDDLQAAMPVFESSSDRYINKTIRF